MAIVKPVARTTDDEYQCYECGKDLTAQVAANFCDRTALLFFRRSGASTSEARRGSPSRSALPISVACSGTDTTRHDPPVVNIFDVTPEALSARGYECGRDQ